MVDVPAVYIILTTYKRTQFALQTIDSIHRNLLWSNLGWIICDDHSEGNHVSQLVEAIGQTNHLWIYDSQRRGVGNGMNTALNYVWSIGGSLILMLEDDWELKYPMDLTPYVNTLLNHEQHGMIRFGYLSPGVQATLINEENRLYWKTEDNGFQYRFTGHPSLRHKRFHDVYGYYDEGLAPGYTELSMCGKVNARSGPNILIPADGGWYGYFHHIGAESLKDIKPEAR